MRRKQFVRWFFGVTGFLASALALTCMAETLPSTPECVARFVEHGSVDPHCLSEADLLRELQAAYAQTTDAAHLDLLGKRLLAVKWWKLWDANFEMAAETIVVGDPVARYFQPTANWQWSTPMSAPLPGQQMPKRLHYAAPSDVPTTHGVKGVLPMLLPVNGELQQIVYFPDGQIPAEIALHIATDYVGNASQHPSTSVRAKWTRAPATPAPAENRPNNFWAGILTPTDGWQMLTVNLCDVGLCGRERAILGIEFSVTGGAAYFGETVIRRPAVEIQGKRPYNVFLEGEPLEFDLRVHNFAASPLAYTVELTAADAQGSAFWQTTCPVNVAANASATLPVMLPASPARYVTLTYALKHADALVAQGHSAAAVIRPNTTGRQPRSPFGMMYWDNPGSAMVAFYAQLGVKLVVLFPELERLHLFDPRLFEIVPMIWELPAQSPREAERLTQNVRQFLSEGVRLFSNFWETDLRVPANLFAPNMQRFNEIVKQLEPAALVGVGGLAWFNVAYLAELLELARTAGAYFDFIALMCYNTPAPPEYSGLAYETAAMRTLLQQAGQPQTEIWNVEWSYFEFLNLDSGAWVNAGVPREQIAAYTLRHHLFGFGADIDRMVPGSNIYAGRMPLAKNYGHDMMMWGNAMFRYDLTPLPMLPAYSVMTRMLEGKTYVKSIGQQPNVIGQLYQAAPPDTSSPLLGSASSVLALWSLFEPVEIALTFPAYRNTAAVPVTVLNMLGEAAEKIIRYGTLQLSLTPEPQYVLCPAAADAQLADVHFDEAAVVLTTPTHTLETPPGQASTLTLTYELFNPGPLPLVGRLQINQPTWIAARRQKVEYLNLVNALLVKNLRTETAAAPDDSSSPLIWLGRQQRAEITVEIEIPATIPRATYYEQWNLTQQPAFELAADLIAPDGQMLGRATTTVRVQPPLLVRLRPVIAAKAEVNAPRVQVQMTNLSAAPRDGVLNLRVFGPLQITPATTAFALTPGQTQTYDFALHGVALTTLDYTVETVDTQLQRHTEHVAVVQDQPFRLDLYQPTLGYLTTFGIGEGYIIEAIVHDHQGCEARQTRGLAFRPAVKAPTPVTLDGRFDEWGAATPLFVHPEGRLNGLTFFADLYGGKMQWRGLDDFSSAWQMMWDDEFLYLAVNVFDDQFVPQHSLGAFWNGDTLLIQIDPQPERADAGLIPTLADLRRIHTFEIGLSAAGPVMRRKYAADPARAGVIEPAWVAIVPEQGQVHYEMALPWHELTPLRPAAGGWFGLSLVWNEDDGRGRETMVPWFGGSGGDGLAREPRLMGDVHLIE